jgi:isopenicillin N synthase-like dioxygenase
MYKNNIDGLSVTNYSKLVATPGRGEEHIHDLFGLLQAGTNGKYKSIEHREFVSSQPRMSIVTFTSPPKERFVGPIPELLVAEELPMYKQYSYGEFMKSYYETYTGSWHMRTSGKNHMHTFMAQPQ